MKLSAYYKKHNQLVIFASGFYPNRHETFIYRKDYEDGNYPKDLMKYSNVQYGGLAFSNNKYHALPIEIERMKPDTTLYNKMESVIREHTSTNKIWQNMLTAEHIRLSLDGKTIWPDYGRQFKTLKQARNLILHDYNLNEIEGGFEEVQRILRRARCDGWATRLGMKFPIQIHDGQSLLNWSSFKTNSTFFGLKYDGIIDNDAFNEWIGVCRERSIFSSIDYHVTIPSYDENHFIKDLLPQIFKQVIISRSVRVFFTLNYDEDFFTDPRWAQVLQLINYYHNSLQVAGVAHYLQKVPTDTLFDFAKATTDSPEWYYHGKCFTRTQIREIFKFVRDNHYELFKMFYECSANSLGGKL